MFSRSIFCLLFLFLLPASVFARDKREDSRITALIAVVESMKDAKFIRNNSEYDGKAAADHLRLKLQNTGERVKTAEEFIGFCASKSSITGQKYRIRFADGSEMDAGVFFQKKLLVIDSQG